MNDFPPASFGALATGAVVGFSSPANYQFHQVQAVLAKASVFNYCTSNLDQTYPNLVTKSEPTIETAALNSTATTLKNWNFESERFVLDTVEISWFSSVYCIGAFVGAMLSNPMSHYLGRKKTLILAVVPAIIGWALIGK